jgi:hypothetical protein
MSHFCHAEPVEACRDIKHLHSPFDELRVTVVTFYEFIKVRSSTVQSQAVVGGDGAGNRGGFDELRSCTNDGTYFHCQK